MLTLAIMGELSVILFSDTTYELHYWIHGFETLAKTGTFNLRFSGGKNASLSTADRGWGSLLFHVAGGGKTVRCYMDIRDGFEQLNYKALESVDLYFKVNYNSSHLSKVLSPGLFAKTRPVGSWFAIRRDGWTNPLTIALKSAWAGAMAQPVTQVKALVNNVKWITRFNICVRKFPRLEYLTENLRGTAIKTDVLFKPRAWRSELKEVTARRATVMEILDRIRIEFPSATVTYGFLDSEIARESYPGRILQTANSRTEYLRDLAGTRIGVVTRGLKGSLNCSIGEHLALETCLFLERPLNSFYIELEDGVNAVLFEPDLSDFEEKIRYYLQHPEECSRVGKNGGEYFRQVYSPSSQALYMVSEAARLLPGSPISDDSSDRSVSVSKEIVDH